jgi:prepilin-type N-terminal cleavage/methylation domain-containing protein
MASASKRMTNKRITDGTKGFTLVELLIAIGVIGILSSIVIAATGPSRMAARDNKRVADLKTIQLGLALYFDHYRVYPTAGEGTAKLAANDQRFLPAIPTDPKTNAAYEYLPSNSNRSYCLGATLEGRVPGDSSSCSLGGGSTANYKVSR